MVTTRTRVRDVVITVLVVIMVISVWQLTQHKVDADLAPVVRDDKGAACPYLKASADNGSWSAKWKYRQLCK